MRAFVVLSISVGILLQSCAPVSTPPRPQTAPTGAPATGAPQSGSSAPSEIRLLVGRGYDGGWYRLYFTDPSNPAADQITGGPDGPLVEAIGAAKLAVDVAIYSLTLGSIRRALIQAHRRGVQVRLVMESDNMDGFDVQAIKDAGIPIIGDRREGLMHDKFVVIDRSEVWTGSMNLTKSSAYFDRNNLIRIRSARLAQDYEAEFSEMFADDHFGPDLGSSTPFSKLTVNDTELGIYFSPDDHVQGVLADLIGSARSRIDFLAYTFTSDPLGKRLRDRASQGIQVSGVMDAGQVQSGAGSEYDTFRAAGLDVRLDGEDNLMHHKVIIIDGETVVTGSYNFTASAETHNDENVLVIHDPAIAARYLEEFERIRAAAQP